MKRPEEALQIAVVQWLRVALPPGWRVHHSPNGGKRGKVEAARFKRMGTSAGFSDLIITGPDRTLIALELKAPGKGRKSGAAKGAETDAQSAWLDHFLACGWHADCLDNLPDIAALLSAAGVPLKARVSP